MTSPIDVAYVEIRPDVDDFDKTLNKELDGSFKKLEDRALKSTQKVEQRFDELETELHENFKEIDKNTTTVFENMNKVVDKTTLDIEDSFNVTGDRINDHFGSTLGDGLTDHFQVLHDDIQESNRRIEENARETVDNTNREYDRIAEDTDKKLRDRDRSITGAAEDIAKNAAGGFGTSFLDGITGSLDSEILKTILLAVLVPAAILAAPLIATALASAIVAALPIGFIGLAIFAQMDNPALQQAGRGFANSLKDIFKRSSEGLVDNLILGLDTILNSFQKMEPTIKRIFDALEPLTQPLAEGIGGFIEEILPGIATAIENSGPVIEEFSQGLIDLGGVLGDFFAKLAEDPDALAGGMRNLFDFIIDAIKVVGDIFVFLINRFQDAKDIIEALGQIFTGLGEFISAAAKAAVGSWEDFDEFWSIMWNGIKEIFFTAIAFVIDGFWLVHDNWHEILDNIGNFFKSVWNSITDAWDHTVGRLINKAKELFNSIKNAGNWGDMLRNAGRAIIDGLINGITSAFGSLRAVLNNVTSLIPSWKGPMEKDKKLLEPTGEAIMGGLSTGIKNGEPNLQDTLSDVTNNIGITPGRSSGEGGIVVNMTFSGATPSESDALTLGQAAGRGIQQTLNQRAVRTAVRTI
jgi:phage-related protein